MQFKVPRQVAIASALALVLGIVSPSAAFAADDAVNPSDDDKSTLVVVQDQDVEEDLDDEEYLDEDDEYLDDEFEDDYVDGEFEDDAYSEDDFEDDDEYLDEDDFEDDEEYLDADDDFEDDEEYLDDEDDYADDDFEDDEEFLDEDDDEYLDDDDDEYLDDDDDEYLDDDEEYSDEDDFEDDEESLDEDDFEDDDEYLDDEEFEDDDESLDEDDFEDDEEYSGEVDFTGEINYELTDAVTEKSAPIGMMATSAVDAPMVTSAAPKSVEDGKRTIADGIYGFGSALKKPMVVAVKSGQSKAGSSVKIFACTGINAQKWRVRYVSDGFYRIFLCGTNLALEVAGNKTSIKTDIRLGEASGAKGQLWAFKAVGSGYYNIISALSPKIALTVEGAKKAEGTNVLTYTAKNTDSQKFTLYNAERGAASNVSLADGTYTIKCASSPSYSVDIKGASKKVKANAQLNSASNTQSQKFYLQSDGNGFYYITVIGSGKVLAPASLSYIPYNNVQQATYSGAMLQKWSLQKTTNGYQLINRATGLALAVSGGKYAKGTNITSLKTKDLGYYWFQLKRTTTLKDGVYSISSVKSTSKVLQSGSTINLQSSDDSIAQRFEIERVNSGSTEIYRIRTGASGGWLTASGSSVIQSGNHGTSVTPANSWQLVWNGSYFSLRNRKAGNVLTLKDGATSNGTAIQVKAASKSNTQHFFFNPANLIPNGTYLLSEGIYSSKSGDRVVDTASFYAQSKAKTAGRDQRFTITARGKAGSTYVIKNTYDGSTLSLQSTSKTEGINVVGLDNAGASTQQWVAKIADGGYVMFVNKYSGKAMTVNKGYKKSGTPLVQNTIDNSASQKFKPIRIEWEVKGDKYYYYDENGNRSTWTKPTYTAYKKLNHNKEVQDEKNSKPYASTIDVSACWVNIFKKSGDLWAPYKCWRCSTGANNSNYATPRGVFHTTGKKGSYGETENLPWGFYYVTVWYPREYGGTGFHSIIYHPNSYNVLDGRLGVHITGGSVRLSLENAKWVYDHFSKGTIVYSY